MRNLMIRKLDSKKAVIAVVGLGYVGLPTAAIFAEAGFKVIGADINSKVIETVSSGKSHIKEPGLDELIRKNVKEGKLSATTSVLEATKDADVIILCVQTPLTKNKRPNLVYLEEACRTVASGLSKGKLVVVQSTVPPRTTRDRIAPILEKISGLRCGEKFWLAYCPERLTPGKSLKEFVENPRIVGGYDAESAEIASSLFKTVVRGEIFVTDSVVAEVAKLSENAFRDVNIAFANELALICERIGVDVMKVITLANTHPRVSIHTPGCGVGGPCLPKDPFLLLSPVKKGKFESKVVEPSRRLNETMPLHTVRLIIGALKKVAKNVGSSKIAILGVAYKGNVDDARNSPAEKIIRELTRLGARVVVYDPYCNESFGAGSAKSIEEAAMDADCLVITTDHEQFRYIKLGSIKTLMKGKPVIVDGKRLLEAEAVKRENFDYYGIGYGLN
jgi:UDP-N-acetyl-D-mannosaminuronic acid dehydrogenase